MIYSAGKNNWGISELGDAFADESADNVDEDANAVATTLFFGGWLRPFPNVAWLSFLDVVPAFFWFAGKVFLFLLVYIWFRATFPRYRFDQLMGLGWKALIPSAS